MAPPNRVAHGQSHGEAALTGYAAKKYSRPSAPDIETGLTAAEELTSFTTPEAVTKAMARRDEILEELTNAPNPTEPHLSGIVASYVAGSMTADKAVADFTKARSKWAAAQAKRQLLSDARTKVVNYTVPGAIRDHCNEIIERLDAAAQDTIKGMAATVKAFESIPSPTAQVVLDRGNTGEMKAYKRLQSEESRQLAVLVGTWYSLCRAHSGNSAPSGAAGPYVWEHPERVAGTRLADGITFTDPALDALETARHAEIAGFRLTTIAHQAKLVSDATAQIRARNKVTDKTQPQRVGSIR